MKSNNNKLRTTLDWALYYHQLGWSIVPVKRNKKNYLDPRSPWLNGRKRATAEQITRWWKRWPKANPAVRTGKISNLVSFKIDPNKACSQNIYKIGLREGIRLMSGNNECFYFFSHPSYYIKSRIGMFFTTGFGIKADGGCILLPPSTLGKGKNYKWVIQPTASNITPIPKWLETEVLEYKEGHKINRLTNK
ncbi:MAG: bifunctional DNA primase/polymerase [Candidatus Taylorbacteria bacterium]|nr:bifunctional DNA primase/polymerase [Candidatus Taylorbacteria bacterium]